MGEIVGGITDALGLTDYKGQRRAQDNAAAAARDANQLSRENMEIVKEMSEANLNFQKEQYNDWKAVYGELQENLGEYFNNLGPEKVTALGLQEQQRAHQQSEEQIKRTMAQRGLGDSKFETYVQTISDVDNANKRATIRATAEERSAQQRMSFLGLGLGQGTQMLGHINSAAGMGISGQNQAAGMGINALTNQANMYNNQFGVFANNNAAMMRQILGTGSEVAGAMIGASDIRIKQNINKVGEINGHNVYTFEFKSNPGKLEMGVMAQEVEEIMPEAVFEIDGVKHVNYSKIFNLGG